MYYDEDYTCRVCHGRRVIPGQHITRECCPNCNGRGEIDWVSHAMGGRGRYSETDTQFLYNIAQRNIQDLIQEIKRQGQMVGVDVDVHVEFRREPTFQEMYLTPKMIPISPSSLPIPKFEDTGD